MTLPVEQVATRLLRVIGGEPSVPTFQLCREAGDYLISMHSWNWLRRPPVALSLVAGQTYIKLPTDLTSVIAIRGPDNFFDFTTVQQLATARAVQSLSGYAYCGAVVYSQSVATGAMVPRLEVWPPIQTTSNTALTLYYEAGIPLLTETATNVQLPDWLNGLFSDLVLAIAQGYDERDVATRQQRLAEIENGPEFLRCKQRDGRIQTSLGQMRGGAIEREAAGYNQGPIIHTSTNAIDPT